MKMTNYIRVELKYCELCGGLWLRYAGNEEVYCGSCAPEMARIARGKKKPAAAVNWEPSLAGAVCA
jgi:Zn-finger nucleic acid-binding protein